MQDYQIDLVYRIYEYMDNKALTITEFEKECPISRTLLYNLFHLNLSKNSAALLYSYFGVSPFTISQESYAIIQFLSKIKNGEQNKNFESAKRYLNVLKLTDRQKTVWRKVLFKIYRVLEEEPVDPVVAAVSSRLAQYLEHQNITPTNFAKKVNINPQILKKFLNQSTYNPTVNTLRKITAGMDTTLESIIVNQKT